MENKLKEEIEKLEEEYKQLNATINETVEKYNNTIRQVQAEGQAVVDDLRIKREGKYQTIEYLRNMLNSLSNTDKELETSDEKPKNTKKKTETKTETKKNDKQEANNTNVQSSSTALTPDEMTNLQNVMNKQTNSTSKSGKIDDIPDYLKDEYKK